MTNNEIVKKVVDFFLEQVKDDFTGGDMHDWEYGKLRMRPALTTTLTAALEERERELVFRIKFEKMQLVDRDTNFGMNEAQRLAYDTAISIITSKKWNDTLQ